MWTENFCFVFSVKPPFSNFFDALWKGPRNLVKHFDKDLPKTGRLCHTKTFENHHLHINLRILRGERVTRILTVRFGAVQCYYWRCCLQVINNTLRRGIRSYHLRCFRADKIDRGGNTVGFCKRRWQQLERSHWYKTMWPIQAWVVPIRVITEVLNNQDSKVEL